MIGGSTASQPSIVSDVTVPPKCRRHPLTATYFAPGIVRPEA